MSESPHRLNEKSRHESCTADDPVGRSSALIRSGFTLVLTLRGSCFEMRDQPGFYKRTLQMQVVVRNSANGSGQNNPNWSALC
jgi:hypothetical protein